MGRYFSSLLEFSGFQQQANLVMSDDASRPQHATASEVSMLVQRWRDGDDAARDALAARMLPELRLLAERALRRLDRPVSLHPSDLVQESIIKLLHGGSDSSGTSHLRALAANIVHMTLIDHQRIRYADMGARDDRIWRAREHAADHSGANCGHREKPESDRGGRWG